jgi:RNA polymerase sigma-70 factor (ECF subfamily)
MRWCGGSPQGGAAGRRKKVLFMPMSDDDPLVRRLRGGDAAALAEFLENHRPQLLAYIERNLGAPLRRKIEPQDVFQETAVSALRALPDADLSGCDPFGWLCQLAEQRIIDAHRRFFGAQKRAADREMPLNAPAGPDGRAELLDLLVASLTTPSQAFSRDQRHLRLLDALALLPAEAREALRLRYTDGLPTKEIARQLNKSDGAVRVLLTRSLNRLQQLLAADGPS